MLCAVTVCSIPYAAAFLVETLLRGPSRWCSVSIFFGFLTHNFINFVVMLISVNLQLVIVHGRKTEGFFQWYILGSSVLALIIVIPGTIENVWGWDPVTGICYVRLKDPVERTAWQVGTGYFWTLASAVIAFISTIAVVVYLISRRIRLDHVLHQTGTSRLPNENIFRAAAWRIMAYPIVMIIYNVISAASDLSLDQSKGITTFAGYALWTTYGFVYGSLPLLYSLILVFVDPSFSVALRDFWKQTSSTNTDEGERSALSSSVHIHLGPPEGVPDDIGEELRDMSGLRSQGSLAGAKGHAEHHESDTESVNHTPLTSKDPPAALEATRDILLVRREFQERRRRARSELRTRLQAELDQI
ncbi:hypothetical protein GLOTRDRAFT_139195 [Gloeophyllum trabeum ATCC 11539]|uniref:G-protein coupled receptors family 2 profile 2 domain-containing protein n=1 Tax=Gloeophyllum trabeum (strain ATCC 11539 / FP-39264 / Madison 617) TaxID=670483 RepID=S7Q591_GLOTA|nr:uncharacterized protein GLOTRDRAFT_139195 [Gloeophyllum trabeum ATCC 11539]EPQ54667.1 hypothetical protein GLOTRDRAFT_139195 [Gloeophyllum trabeum ATCC 11539]